MAINRYDRPAESNYFNTFVPLPYNEIMGTVAARQSQLDRAQAQMDESYEQAQLFNAIPGSIDEQRIKDIQGFISDWSGKWYNEDMSDPIIRRQAMNEYRTKIDRPFIKDAESSYQAWRANQEVKRRYQMEGKYHEMLDTDPAKDWDSRQGVYNYMTPALLQSRPVAEQYFNNMKASILKDAKGNPLKTSEGYTRIGITNSDIDRVISERWRDFADTAEGRQAVNIAAMRRGINPGDLTESQLREISTDILRDVGKEYTYDDITGSRDPRDTGTQTIPRIGSGTIPSIRLGAKTTSEPKANVNQAYRNISELDRNISSLNKKIQEHEEGLPTGFANEQEYILAKNELSNLQTIRAEEGVILDEAMNRANALFEPSFKSASTKLQRNINDALKSNKISQQEANEILELLASGDFDEYHRYMLPSTIARMGESFPNIFSNLAGAVNKGISNSINNLMGNTERLYSRLSKWGIVPVEGEEVLSKVTDAVKGGEAPITQVIGTPHSFKLIDQNHKSEIVYNFLQDVNSISKERNKVFDNQYKLIEPKVKQASIFTAPNLTYNLTDNQYTAIVNNPDGTQDVRRASGFGRLANDLKNTFDTFMVEKYSDENTFDRKRDKKNLTKESTEEMKKKLKTHTLYPVGTEMKRNDDGSLTVYVTPKDKDGVQKGLYGVTIPAEYDDLIQSVINDLLVESPYEYDMVNGERTVFTNPQIYRLQIGIDSMFADVKNEKEFEIPIGNSAMKVEKVDGGHMLYNTDGSPVWNTPVSLETIIQHVTRIFSILGTGQPVNK